MKLLMEQWKKFVEAAETEKQKNFMHAVKNCKEDGDCPSDDIEKAAGSMTMKQVKDYTTKPVKEELDSHEDKTGDEVASAHQSELDAATKLKQISKEQIEEMVRQELTEADPCWDGYQQIGMKDKDGKEVPNCVPIEEQELEEGGQCTGPTQKASSTSKGKKWMQCVKNPNGKGYKRIHWGQKGVRVTGDSGNTKRKKSFRARHGCKDAKAGTAKYMACKDW
jgi:hypothetical protein